MRKLLFFILLTGACYALEPFVLMSNPKSGTMYLRDILRQATGLRDNFHHNGYKEGEYFGVCHCVNGFNSNYKTILLYRDPREMIISYAYYLINQCQDSLRKGRQHGWLKEHTNEYLFLSIQDKIRYIFDINHDTELKEHMSYLNERVKMAQGNPNILCVKYEDLTGPKGGGDARRRRETLQKIREFLKIDRSLDDLVWIAEDTWGKSSTFRRGKIKAWREHFDASLCQELKQTIWNDLIVDLGYESSRDW